MQKAHVNTFSEYFFLPFSPGLSKQLNTEMDLLDELNKAENDSIFCPKHEHVLKKLWEIENFNRLAPVAVPGVKFGFLE